MADGYRVNTDELERVVTRLRNLQKNLGETASKAKYNTVIEPSDVGWEFPEAHELHSAHTQMKASLEDLITQLGQMIDDFGGKTQAVTNSYKETEHNVKAGMDGGVNGSGTSGGSNSGSRLS
ncbi:hypothetical protein [Peterkaempfera griseoplana]|uniref:hypothetical protein n=1 Tax=Peterkaempfera griseoplana TaxID=66896 RepID=UPI0006E19F75|nr:hypothetical protein [Peterkaempfera griseoplana]